MNNFSNFFNFSSNEFAFISNSFNSNTAFNFFFLIFFIIFCIITFLPVLLYTASFTLVERKVMGLFQRREGPDKVGLEGIGQPLADGAKLIKKETVFPKDTPSQAIFVFAPLISLSISLLLWSTIPFSSKGAFVNSEIMVIIFLAVSSMGSYGVIYAGWSSNNKYALMGSFRSVAQLISYEIIFSLIFMPAMVSAQSASFYQIVSFQKYHGCFIWYFFPFIIFYAIVALAETNRTPFDLPEAEAELVSGFNVEYSSLLFAAFFLAEYGSMGVISAIFIIFFCGGWGTSFGNKDVYSSTVDVKLYDYGFFFDNFSFFSIFFEVFSMAFKITFFSMFFIFVRAALPRKRFDQLVHLCWKVLFPLSFSIVLLSISLLVTFINFFSFMDSNNWIFFI